MTHMLLQLFDYVINGYQMYGLRNNFYVMNFLLVTLYIVINYAMNVKFHDDIKRGDLKCLI